MSDKKHFWQQSRFWVIFYAVVVLIFLCLNFVLGILNNFNIKFFNKTLNELVNGNIELPISVFSYGWTALISFYCCSDRIVDIAKTTKLSIGQMSMGDLEKMRGMISISFLLLVFSTVFNCLVDRNFELTAFASAFAMTIISYVVGNKAVKASAFFGKEIDSNENGVPDEAEAAYNKWNREQIKNGVELEYRNWNYFLDDPRNEYWEKKFRKESVNITE